MFPHVAEALDIVKERRRQREAKQLHARRTYLRSLLLGELPIGGATALAEAAEELSLSPMELRRDAEAALASQRLRAELLKLHQASNAAVAAAKAEQPQWRLGCDPDEFHTPGPAIRNVDRILRENENRAESLKIQLRQCHDNAPHLFGPDVFSLIQPPATEPPATPQPARFNPSNAYDLEQAQSQAEEHDDEDDQEVDDDGKVGSRDDGKPIMRFPPFDGNLTTPPQPQPVAPRPTPAPETWS